MNDYMTPIYNYGFEVGYKEGYKKGFEKGYKEGLKMVDDAVCMMYEGKTDEDIAQAIPDYPIEEIHELRKELAPFLDQKTK